MNLLNINNQAYRNIANIVFGEFKIISYYYSLPFDIMENNFHQRLIVPYYYNRDYEGTIHLNIRDIFYNKISETHITKGE
jgi:hypothetical protein